MVGRVDTGNTRGTKRIQSRAVTEDEYDQVFAALPVKVREWLMFDAPKALDPANIKHNLDAGYSLEQIKAAVRRGTLDVYGREYPA